LTFVQGLKKITNLVMYFTGVGCGVMVIDSCAGTLTEDGTLFVYFTDVGGVIMVIDTCTGNVREDGRLVVYCTAVGGGVMVIDSCTLTEEKLLILLCIVLAWVVELWLFDSCAGTVREHGS
jgi:hypothetical protein